MSDQNKGFPFAELEQEDGLDYAAIFGGGTSGSSTNPFEIPAAEQAAAPQPQITESAAPDNPISAAIARQEEAAAQTPPPAPA